MRERFDSSNKLIGSGRSGAGDHVAWLARGTLARRALPAARLSAMVGAFCSPRKEMGDLLMFLFLAVK